MLKKVALFFVGISIFFSPITLIAQPTSQITICTDTNFWYPFTFVKNQDAAGLHIDIISRALRNINIEPIYRPMAWKECLQQAKEGLVDAVATVSYRDERALYLNFPEGAATDIKSPWRVTQVEYVVITPLLNSQDEKNTYVFAGQAKTIPQPVRVIANYSVAKDLRKEGLKVKEGKDALTNFKKLIKERSGSVVDLEEVAEYYAMQPEFAGKFVIQKYPLTLKSYYLAFSKAGSVKEGETKIMWQSIANVRNNKALIAEYLKKY